MQAGIVGSKRVSQGSGNLQICHSMCISDPSETHVVQTICKLVIPCITVLVIRRKSVFETWKRDTPISLTEIAWCLFAVDGTVRLNLCCCMVRLCLTACAIYAQVAQCFKLTISLFVLVY